MFDEHSALGIAIERFCVEQAEFRARLVQGGPTPMPDGVPADGRRISRFPAPTTV
jgi:hypothetical protein